MKINAKNLWHKKMYNLAFANFTIGSPQFQKLAEKQVQFLHSKLGLKKGAKVLDVPCGTGRHSKIFARLGYQVTGVDISSDCLLMAQRKAKHKNILYVKGNIANLRKFHGQFDLVVNLFTSFGYFHTDKENEAVLKEMVRCLKTKGKIVVHLRNRDSYLKNYKPTGWHETNGRLMIEATKYDPLTKYNEAHVTLLNIRSSKPKLEHYHYHRLRLYSKDELVQMMKRVGLTDIQVFGDFEGNKFSKFQSSHPIYVGTRR